jgi:hypothetical protein
MSIVTPQAAAGHELLFNKSASEVCDLTKASTVFCLGFKFQFLRKDKLKKCNLKQL